MNNTYGLTYYVTSIYVHIQTESIALIWQKYSTGYSETLFLSSTVNRREAKEKQLTLQSKNEKSHNKSRRVQCSVHNKSRRVQFTTSGEKFSVHSGNIRQTECIPLVWQKYGAEYPGTAEANAAVTARRM